MARQHAAAIENGASLSIFCPDAEHLPAQQKCAFGIHIHHQVPRLQFAFMQWAITFCASADAHYVKERINFAEPFQTCCNGFANGGLIAHIRDGKACFSTIRGERATLLLINSDDKYRIVGSPPTCGGGRNP